MRVAMTIAGSDSGGGAGIQADLKTFEAFGLFGTSAVTAVTAQNTLGVRGVWEVPVEGVAAQIDAILDDFPVAAIKIGMLASEKIVRVVADRLESLHEAIPVVLDPVMVATSGDLLLDPGAVDALRNLLLPLATIITPNLAEGRVLTGASSEPEDLVEELSRLGPGSVLLTGGDEAREAPDGSRVVVDLLRSGEETIRLQDLHIDTTSTHGTGCTLSSGIASSLALGRTIEESVGAARAYVREGLLAAPGLGSGHGPLRHSGRSSLH